MDLDLSVVCFVFQDLKRQKNLSAYTKKPRKIELAFLAIDPESKAILGFLQMS
jgi:hypothetical protein